jgi:hypothetical protein
MTKPNGGTTKTYRSPFGIEVDRREAHLAALPGKVYHEWFESLNRASRCSAAKVANWNGT